MGEVAKLYFRYGAMNSGKSTALLQAAHNYEERDQFVSLAKPGLDTKGMNRIVSRLGVEREVDFMIGEDDSVIELFENERTFRSTNGEPVTCLLIDEAQFLSRGQVDELMKIAVRLNVPVLCYGIRTDFRTHAFPGSARLMEIAHSVEELKTICRCGRKAIFNTRIHQGRFVFDGDQVAIDGEDVSYESLCADCYLTESGGRLS